MHIYICQPGVIQGCIFIHILYIYTYRIDIAISNNVSEICEIAMYCYWLINPQKNARDVQVIDSRGQSGFWADNFQPDPNIVEIYDILERDSVYVYIYGERERGNFNGVE